MMPLVSKSNTSLVIALLILFSSLPVEQALANGPTTEQYLEDVMERVDDELDEFDAFGWPLRGRFPKLSKPAQSYVDFNRRLWNKRGMTYGFTPTLMMQKGTQGGNHDFTANEQINGLFAWRILNKTRVGTGLFVFNFLHVGQLSNTRGVDFSQSFDISYFTSDSVANTDVVKALLWQHDFPGEKLMLKLGHGEISGVINGCRYACDDTLSFLSTPLSAYPASTLPGQGPMISATVQPIDGMFFELAVADALGDGKLDFQRVFRTDDLAYAGALKFVNPFESVGDGEYRFGYYKIDPTGQGSPSAQAASDGYSIHIDQDFGELGAFAKYNRAFERKGPIERSASAGIVWKKPFGFDEDWLGVGVGLSDPSAADSKREYVTEAYYRLQLTPFIEITPAIMLVLNSSSNPENDTEAVFTLRARGKF